MIKNNALSQHITRTTLIQTRAPFATTDQFFCSHKFETVVTTNRISASPREISTSTSQNCRVDNNFLWGPFPRGLRRTIDRARITPLPHNWPSLPSVETISMPHQTIERQGRSRMMRQAFRVTAGLYAGSVIMICSFRVRASRCSRLSRERTLCPRDLAPTPQLGQTKIPQTAYTIDHPH